MGESCPNYQIKEEKLKLTKIGEMLGMIWHFTREKKGKREFCHINRIRYLNFEAKVTEL